MCWIRAGGGNCLKYLVRDEIEKNGRETKIFKKAEFVKGGLGFQTGYVSGVNLFCNFHAVFGHFVQIVPLLVDPIWETLAFRGWSIFS